jgi:hypothetical protein
VEDGAKQDKQLAISSQPRSQLASFSFFHVWLQSWQMSSSLSFSFVKACEGTNIITRI